MKDIIWILLQISLSIVILYKISQKEYYNYDNALIKGKIVSGTVYTQYPNQNTGLGWVL